MPPNRTSHNLGMDAVILAGGLGTRLRPVIADRPKALAPIGSGDRVFLDFLLEYIRAAGFPRVILCVGHLRDQIMDRYRGMSGIFFSEEETPLGTGGAVKRAHALVTSDDFLVLNGDTMFNGLDLAALVSFHKNSGAMVSMALAKPRKENDFGSVILARDNSIAGYTEKKDPGVTGLMNGGVYVMNKKIFAHMPEGPFSLEKDLFPRLTKGLMRGYCSEGEVVDIGTPERYKIAKTIFS